MTAFIQSVPSYAAELAIFFGASLLYILDRLNSRQPFSVFTAFGAAMDMNAHWFKVLMDLTISSAIGTLVVLIVAYPNTMPQAFLAGLGWTGILTVPGKNI